MDRGYLRAPSPSRRYGGHPARNSTGLLELHPPSYESYYPPRGSREGLGPRSSADRFDRPPPPRPYHHDSLPPRRNPDDYDIAPRRVDPRRPLVVPPADAHNYRPVIKSALESPPEYRRPRPREAEAFYLTPNTPGRDRHHRTLSSSGYGGAQYRDVPRANSTRLPPRDDRDRRSREYHNIPAIRPPRDHEDRDYGYEYTDMKKEQAYYDAAAAPRPRGRRESDAGTRERPNSITGVEDMSKRPTAGSRGEGPPVTTRGFNKLDRNGSVRQYRYPRDSEGSAVEDEPIARRKSKREDGRAQVAVHQDRADDYNSNTEDRAYPRAHKSRHDDAADREPPRRSKPEDESDRPRKHHDRHLSVTDDDGSRHHRRRHSFRDDSRDIRKPEVERKDRTEEQEAEYKRRERGEESDRPHRRKDPPAEPDREYRPRERGGDLEDKQRRHKRERSYDRRPDVRREDRKEKPESHHHLAEATLGTAAAAAAAGGAGLYAKHRHDRESEAPEKPRELKDERRRRHHYKESNEESDTTEAEPTDSERERKERRRRRKEREEREREEATAAAAGVVAAPRGKQPAKETDDGQSKDLALVETAVPASGRRPEDGDRRGRRHHDSEGSAGSSGSASTQKRQVRVVSPAKEPEAKPKGILKQPKVKFPEDPAPIREGVAPLKDAGKKGIPPNARWTKIDRRLVNPEALEVGNERFEERSDYVIVLRVLNKEEIEAYAAKTAEIREERHLEQQRSRTLALEEREHRSEGDEDEDRGPLAIDDHAHNDQDIAIPGMPGYDKRQAVPELVTTPHNMTASAPNLQDPYAGRPDMYAGNSFHRPNPNGSASMTSSVNSAQTWPQSNVPPHQAQQATPSQPTPGGYPPHPGPPPPHAPSSIMYPQVPQSGSQGGQTPYPPPSTTYQKHNPPPPPPASNSPPSQQHIYAQGSNPPMQPYGAKAQSQAAE